MTTVWMGVDIGTSRVKAVARTSTGDLAFGSVPTPWDGVSLDPGRLDDAVLACVRSALSEAGAPLRVAAVGVCSMGEAGLFVGPKGPLGPIAAWQDISLTAPLFRAFRAEFAPEAVFEATGIAPQPKFGLFRMRAAGTPGPRTWLQAADYVIWALSGGARVTHANLAARTMAYAWNAGAWADDLLAWAGCGPENLPELVFAPGVHARVRDDWPELRGAALVHAGQDHGAAYYGSGLPLGYALDSSGTAEPWVYGAAAPVLSPEALSAQMMWAPAVGGEGFSGLLPNAGGGAAERWAARSFGEGVRSGRDRVRFDPGGWAEGSATFSGVSAETGPGGLYQAVLEGVVDALQGGLGNLRKISGAELADVAWCGGAVCHQPWTAVRHERIPARLWAMHPHEGSLLGALRAAMAAVGEPWDGIVTWRGPGGGDPPWMPAPSP